MGADVSARVGNHLGLDDLPSYREDYNEDRDTERDHQEIGLVPELPRTLPPGNAHADNDQAEEDQPHDAGVRRAGHLKWPLRDDASVDQSSKSELTREDGAPGEDHPERRRLQSRFEGIRVDGIE